MSCNYHTFHFLYPIPVRVPLARTLYINDVHHLLRYLLSNRSCDVRYALVSFTSMVAKGVLINKSLQVNLIVNLAIYNLHHVKNFARMGSKTLLEITFDKGVLPTGSKQLNNCLNGLVKGLSNTNVHFRAIALDLFKKMVYKELLTSQSSQLNTIITLAVDNLNHSNADVVSNALDLLRSLVNQNLLTSKSSSPEVSGIIGQLINRLLEHQDLYISTKANMLLGKMLDNDVLPGGS